MAGIIKERLYTPGPTPLLMEGQARTLTATLHHRTEGFRRLLKETLENLRYYYNTKNDVLIFSSSGTGAMEGAISNLLSPGERVLIGTAGKFGERWGALAKAYGVEAVTVEVPYGQTLPIDAMSRRLETDGPFGAVFVQATESSTGVRHDVEALAAAVRRYPETCLVVDAITGLGTTDLRPDEWGLDVVIGGSQKATMVPPGLAFASVSDKAWKRIEKSKLPRYYFDFAKERKNLAGGESSFTPATTLIVALHAALAYIHELGRENLIANAALLAEAARAAAGALGLKLFAVSNPANAVTAIYSPEGMDSGLIVKEVRARFGAIITNGQGSMKGKIFRLAHLGYYDFLDLVSVVAALEIALVKLGHTAQLGAGIRAAEEVYIQRLG
ncbi:MAG TPA: alanine--glyoxylate aminotransferase family protein [Terriglobia bacterium]|nr:alanine--glyoxylate aminotransferase family protein [Terriglobia bacterium]